jgi:hypothetical protein
MRRRGHPSRPRAITCCFFASLKTLLIPTKATALHRNQRPRVSFSLAGFQVTLIGRFWVTAEEAHALHDWTDGCVAVSNEEMDEIWKLVRVGTPIEIKP